MEDPRHSYEELSRMCDDLERQVGRHISVEQDLIKTRDALDRELRRFRAMQAYTDRALRASSLDELTTASLESIIDAFEFERSALFRVSSDSSDLEVVGHFGFRSMPKSVSLDADALAETDSRILGDTGDGPLPNALSALGLVQAIVCPFFDQQGKLYGFVLGGLSKEKRDYYAPITADVRSAFTVMVRQVGALWLNYQLNVLMRERKYGVLFHRSNDGILLCELDGTILDTNRRALEMFGYDPIQMRAMKVFELAVPEERAESQARFAALGEQGSVRVERCCLTCDGTIFPAEISASLFELDGKLMVHGLIRDITELRRSQQQLVLSERLAALGQLIAGIAHEVNTPIGVIQAAVGNMSTSLDETLAQLPALVRDLPQAQLGALFTLLERARRGRPTLSAREERTAKRGLGVLLADAGVPDADAVADTLVDMGITTGVEPLLPLLASSLPGVLQAAYNLSSLKRNSVSIQTAVERASKVIFALKKFAHRDHSGKMVRADLSDGIETVLTLYQNQLKQGVEVTRRYAPVGPVLCHPDELNQVWTNLIHNALQAMDNRGTLDITLGRTDEHAVVAFTDSGTGVPAEIAHRIFEPFFTTKPAGEGSGLGLDICRRIVERHSGQIAVVSVPGGTTFTVTLPLDGVGDE